MPADPPVCAARRPGAQGSRIAVSLLSIAGVSKRFGGIEALTDLNMAIQPGLVTALIGPNGAGKSTVVNLITGMFGVTSGSIRFRGDDITGQKPTAIARLGIARTFQNVRLLAHESVLDNILVGYHRHATTSLLANLIGFPSAWRESRRLREAARALLQRFGMERFAEQQAGSLSYGHQRRLEIIRAMAAAPDLILFDEPAAGMNDVEADELGLVFREIASGGVGVLLIEHNTRLVMSLCDEVNVLNAGRIIASGKPAQVCEDPDVIAAYLGSQP